jgi:hypothetical protein
VPERLRLYISAGPDLDLEREFIGQAVAGLPISRGWEINYTPGIQERRGVDASPILGAHFRILLLGQDISAPVGWELWTAKRAGRAPTGIAKEVSRTLAAQTFWRESGLDWIGYHEPAELAALVQKKLGEAILADPVAYGLAMTEWEPLSAFIKHLDRAPGAQAPAGRVQGLGRSGVILTPEDAGKGGVLVRG